MHEHGINAVLIIMMVFAFMGVLRSRGLGRGYRHMQDEIDYLRSSRPAPAALPPSATKEQVGRLEDRVRVLERIVTDRGSNLAAEIEALRDRRPAHESEGSN